MTLPKALCFVCIVASLCGAIGAALGLLIGAFAPDVYRVAFSFPGSPTNLDPLQIGLGLGLAQGILGGSLVGVMLVAIVTWYEVRTEDRKADSEARH